MANEQGAAVVEEGLTAEQKAEQEAFAAEMADTEGVETDAIAPVTAKVEATPQPEVIVEPVVERKEVIKGFTEEEIRAALEELPKLRKSIDTTAGTFGQRLADQQQLITTLQAQKQAVGNLSPEKLTRLSKEYPELAEILASDLNEYIGQGGQQQVVAPDPAIQAQLTNDIVNQRLLEKERRDELKLLAKKHADWQETASFSIDNNQVKWKNPKFGKWVQKQKPDVAAKITGVWDADYVASQLDKFKEDAKPTSASNELDAAVLPRGTRRVTKTVDESDEDAAFRAEMARR